MFHKENRDSEYCTWYVLQFLLCNNCQFISIYHGLRTSRESFFSKIRNLWAWADKLGWTFLRHLGYFWPNYKHCTLWVPCTSENVAVSLSSKKLWFLGLKHITPKCSQNKKWAVKNAGNSVHTSVFRGIYYNRNNNHEDSE